MRPEDRIEVILDSMAKGCACDLKPNSREEAYLIAIANRLVGGGSSGGSGGGVIYLNVETIQDDFSISDPTYQCEKTSAEINQLVIEGNVVILVNEWNYYHLEHFGQGGCSFFAHNVKLLVNEDGSCEFMDMTGM